MSGNQSSLPLAGSQFGFAQHGAHGTWVSDLLPHTAQDRRRALHRPLDVHRGDQSRSGDHVLPDRLADRRAAEHGRVGALRPRQRQRGPAGVRRADHAGQGRSAALRAAVGQRLPAVAASGRAVPQRQGPGAVSRQSRRRHAREPAPAARSPARSARARGGAARRSRGRRAHRAVRDGVSHAGERARRDGPVATRPTKRSSSTATTRGRRARSRPTACWRGGWPRRACKFIQLYHQGWDQHDNLPKDIQRQCRETDQRQRRAA